MKKLSLILAILFLAFVFSGPVFGATSQYNSDKLSWQRADMSQPVVPMTSDDQDAAKDENAAADEETPDEDEEQTDDEETPSEDDEAASEDEEKKDQSQ